MIFLLELVQLGIRRNKPRGGVRIRTRRIWPDKKDYGACLWEEAVNCAIYGGTRNLCAARSANNISDYENDDGCEPHQQKQIEDVVAPTCGDEFGEAFLRTTKSHEGGSGRRTLVGEQQELNGLIYFLPRAEFIIIGRVLDKLLLGRRR